LRPGGYDFARDMYFQRIGASGYALGKIRTVAPPVNPGFWLHYAGFIDGIRAWRWWPASCSSSFARAWR
jgi:competence protein ComEC